MNMANMHSATWCRPTLRITPFEKARQELIDDVIARLAPIDVGFDLRFAGLLVELPEGDPLVVSYAVQNGERMIVAGPRQAVIGVLERAGYMVKRR